MGEIKDFSSWYNEFRFGQNEVYFMLLLCRTSKLNTLFCARET